MKLRSSSSLIASLFTAAAMLQGNEITDQRSADIRGGGGDGKCTIEVEVDDTAEVEIFGRNARIRTLGGSAANFRRFQCNQEMPNNPGEFSFRGIDGRGRQTLVRNPGRGPAVVRIEDRQGGRHGYTFDIMWRGANGPWNNSNNNGGGWNGGNNGNGGNGGIWGNGNGNGNGGWNNGNGNGNGGVWNNGGGNGGWNSGWNNDISYNARGTGSISDNRGNRNSIRNGNFFISRNGEVRVEFLTDQNQSLNFSGRVLRSNGNRIVADVNSGVIAGQMEFTIDSRNRITNADRIEVTWRN
jgi:hypothetical protein